MKKIFSTIILLTLLSVLVVPMVVSAQASECTLRHNITDIDAACTKGTTVSETQTKAWGMCCLLDAVYTVTDWIFVILIIVVGLLIIWGAFDIVTAAGSTEKVSAGRNKILYAVIGLVVALLAKAIPSVVKALLGV
jgi:hypothetical protein